MRWGGSFKVGIVVVVVVVGVDGRMKGAGESQSPGFGITTIATTPGLLGYEEADIMV